MSDFGRRIYDHYVHAREIPLTTGRVEDLQKRAPFLRKLIRDHLPQDRDSAILDLGCGHGAILHFLREAGYHRLIGIDRSSEQVAAARQLGIAEVRQGDLLECLREMPDASHDAIVSFDVIEHFSKPEILAVTDEVRRVLKPDGRWLIHAPNAEAPFGARMRYWDFTHEIAFTRESIRQLLLSSGFRSVGVYEDVPVPHGVKSAVRFVLWKLIRTIFRAYLLVETGTDGAILSQNLVAVATK